MNYLIATFVFFLTLGLSTTTIAETHETTCTPESKQCAGAEVKAHGETENELAVKMNSLFPEKKKNTALATKPTPVETMEPKFLAAVPAGAVKLVWSESKGTTEYHVQVATDPNFKWLLVNEKFVKGTNFDFAKAEAGKKYFWRVAAFNRGNDPYYMKSNFNSSAFTTK